MMTKTSIFIYKASLLIFPRVGKQTAFARDRTNAGESLSIRAMNRVMVTRAQAWGVIWDHTPFVGLRFTSPWRVIRLIEKNVECGDLCIYVSPLEREAIIFTIHLRALHLRMKGFLYPIPIIFAVL
ncbi:hypothetical protein Hanom_Chr00s014375g01752701 [Helianthus anomalus]